MALVQAVAHREGVVTVEDLPVAWEVAVISSTHRLAMHQAARRQIQSLQSQT